MPYAKQRMVRYSAVSLFVIGILAYPAEGQYFGEIDCDKEAQSIDGCTVSDPPVQCTVTCTSPCSTEGSSPEIYGTGDYSYDSPVCRSASHDTRLPYFASSPTNVTFYRKSDPERFLPTIQHGIISTEYGTLGHSDRGSFIFTTPYITEDLLDATTLNFNSLYTDSNNLNQLGQVNDKTDKCYDFDFKFYIPTSAKQNGDPNIHAAGARDASWSGTQLQPGGYWTKIVNNTYSDVMSLTMAADADFLPDQWTLTASVLDNVVIKFTPKQMGSTSTDVTWKKDTQSLYSFPNMVLSQNASGYYLAINNITTGDSGIYSLENNGNTAKQGITRLIVRRCPKDMFGPICDQQCPPCQNGGVCHDVMGTCLCPPGLTGDNCQQACAYSHFGQSCSHTCGDYKYAGTSGYCKGALICLPDPFGCACSTGFTGLECKNQAGCQHGSKYLGCSPTRACKCAGNQGCDTKTNTCRNGCAEGWKSKRCDTSYPYLNDVPTLSIANSDSLEVQFAAWNQSHQGSGNPQNEIVEIRDLSSSCNKWTAVKTVPNGSGGQNSAVIDNLNPSTTYAVRVVVQDVDGNAQRELAPIAVFNKTASGAESTDESITPMVTTPGAESTDESITPMVTTPGVESTDESITPMVPTPEAGSTDASPTPNVIDSSLCDKLKQQLQARLPSASLNPYSIPTIRINLGSERMIFSGGQAWQLQNLKADDCTTTGNIATLRIRANNVYLTGALSDFGPANLGQQSIIFIRTDIPYFDVVVTIKAPSDSISVPRLVGFQANSLQGIRVTTRGGLIQVFNRFTTALAQVIQQLFPAQVQRAVVLMLQTTFSSLFQTIFQ